MTANLERWNAELQSGDANRIAHTARELAEERSRVDPNFTFTLTDKFWKPIGALTGYLMEGSGTDPRNALPTANLKLKSDCPYIEELSNCRNTLVGVIVETGGLRFPYYVDVFHEEFKSGEWTYTAECKGIWDILNHMVIWPSWWLPIQTQPFSHAVYIWAICTAIENMAAEQALRLQSGIWEFVNNALSLNPDMRAWFGTLLQSNGNIFQMLKTPVYVVRTNPFLDGSPLIARTVRMETVGAVIQDVTKAYGIDVRMDLWLPGDAQPDRWANLNQPTYVMTVKDRSQIEGPTKTVLDSVLRTVIDLGGSLGGIFRNVARSVPGMSGQFYAPGLGVDYTPPWAVLVAPDPGKDGSVLECKISHHTPTGWQHIIGGRSPKWLNDLMNAFFAFVIDAIMIVIGFSGIPSDLLAGFLNNAFFAFQLMQSYDRRDSVGPYHPAVERFYPTASAPYNIETVFAFINALWDSRGYTSATATFRNGEIYTLGKDVFRGGLMSVAYRNRTKLFTDYVENVMWRITPDSRDVMVQIGDGKAEESPLAKHQRWLTGILESISILTLAPQSAG